MRHEQYRALLQRVEAYAAAHPRAYRLRLVGLIAAGYLYIALMFFLLLVPAGVLSWFWLRPQMTHGGGLLFTIAVLGAGTIVAGRMLWTGFPRPSGIPVGAESAPGLVALVRMLTARLRTPRVHRILLTTNGMLGMAARPRLGPFGWYRNSLLLGLPVMRSLSPDEFRAALAHELGHLSRRDGRFGAWIYRMRLVWLRLGGQGYGGQYYGTVGKAFLKRWAPYFNAYSFVLARREEYDADRFAMQLAGKTHLARALAKLEVVGAYLRERWWPSVLAQAAVEPEPSPGAIASLVEALDRGVAPKDRTRWLTRALRQTTGDTDTHPSLSDRLAALGVDRAVVSAAEDPRFLTAAEFYFADAWPGLQARLGELWVREAQRPWRHRHAGIAHARKRAAELDARAAAGPLRPTPSWERILLELEQEGVATDRAVPALRAFVERFPDHAQARYTLGSALLEHEDTDGVEHVLLACEHDPDVRGPGYELVSRFYEREGRTEEAETYRQRSWAATEAFELAGEERRFVTRSDRLLPHALNPDEVQALRQQLSELPAVTAAYIARQDVRHLAEKPHYIVGVQFTLKWWWRHSVAQTRAHVSRVLQGGPLRGSWSVLCGRGDQPHAWGKLKRVPGAELMRR